MTWQEDLWTEIIKLQKIIIELTKLLSDDNKEKAIKIIQKYGKIGIKDKDVKTI